MCSAAPGDGDDEGVRVLGSGVLRFFTIIKPSKRNKLRAHVFGRRGYILQQLVSGDDDGGSFVDRGEKLTWALSGACCSPVGFSRCGHFLIRTRKQSCTKNMTSSLTRCL